MNTSILAIRILPIAFLICSPLSNFSAAADDECYSLGARQIRTPDFAGAAVFQSLVATTNNLLQWMNHKLFKDTSLEQIGNTTVVHQAVQIPGKLLETTTGWVVQLSAWQREAWSV
jgi:hypothetical protein